jgi:hypothetical protein
MRTSASPDTVMSGGGCLSCAEAVSETASAKQADAKNIKEDFLIPAVIPSPNV